MGTVSRTGSGTASRRRRGRSHPGLPRSSNGGSGERQDTGDKVKSDFWGRWRAKAMTYSKFEVFWNKKVKQSTKNLSLSLLPSTFRNIYQKCPQYPLGKGSCENLWTQAHLLPKKGTFRQPSQGCRTPKSMARGGKVSSENVDYMLQSCWCKLFTFLTPITKRQQGRSHTSTE